MARPRRLAGTGGADGSGPALTGSDLREALLAGPHEAALRVLGARLVAGTGMNVREGVVVEVEAYGGADDAASHARAGLTRRNAAMFGPPGHAYVYRVYGMHCCLNVVTGPAGSPSAILLRAVRPTAGRAAMRADRLAAAPPRVRADRMAYERERRRIEVVPDARLAAGPALVCAAFGIDLSHDGIDLTDPTSPLRLELGEPLEPSAIVTGGRVGIAYAGEAAVARPWRVALAGDPAISRPFGRREPAASSPTTSVPAHPPSGRRASGA